MRPVRLALENFGPYRERAEIDFPGLGDFFLICGKTGSGKSTLFDAMTYALFGKAPGARDGLEGELASDFSAPGERPVVEFEFELSGSGFRVERVAPHQRPKRGGGLTEVPASAVMTRKSGDAWLPVADGVKEVGAKVASLVGLSADEFSKVILLPQGAFQNFLDMKSSDRATVLEKLFPVAIYDTITELSKRKADEAKAALAALDSEIGRISSEEGADAESRAAETERELAAALGIEKSASDALKAAERRLEDERERAARAERALRAVQALTELEGLKASADARLGRIARARAAASVQPAITLFNREKADFTDAESRLALARDEAVGLEERIRAAGDLAARISEAESGITARRKELFALQRGLEAWKRRTDALKRLQTAELAVGEARQAASTLLSGMDALRAELEETRIALAGEAGLRNELEGYEARARLLERMRELATRNDGRKGELERVAGEKAAAEADLGKAENSRQSARDKLTSAESRAAAEAAARLADMLVPGQACPVCGSTEHPAPAAGPHGPKALDEAETSLHIEVARELLIRLSGDSARLSAAISHLSGRRDALAAEIGTVERELSELARSLRGTVLTAAGIEASIAACRTEISTVRNALEVLRNRRDNYEAGLKRLEEQRTSLETARAATAQAESGLGVAAAMVTEAERESGTEDPEPAIALIAAEIGRREAEKEENERVRTTLEKEKAASLARLETLGRVRDEKTVSRAAAEKQLFAALRASGFLAPDEADLAAGLREVASAALPASVVDAEEKAAGEYREALAGARAQAQSLKADLPEVNKGGLTPIIISALEAEAAAARAALDAARSASDGLKLALDRLKDAIGRRAAAYKRRESLADEAQKLHSLSSLLRGDMPGRKLPFKNFVLAMYFREVIARASSHLSLMSDGRYYLSPEDTASPVPAWGS